MDQHTYSFPKVTPADPDELREDIRAARREAGDREPTERPRRLALLGALRPTKG